MLSEWEKFAGWKVLRHFLDQPTTEVYIRELARITKLSPRSAQVYCTYYEKEALLLSQKKANAKMFRLNNESVSVRALKRFYFLMRLDELRIAEKIAKANPQLISLALYGSYASGDYDERSDIDILIISDNKIDRKLFVKLEKELGKTIQLTELSLANWLSMKNKNDAFAIAILRNNVILEGVGL